MNQAQASGYAIGAIVGVQQPQQARELQVSRALSALENSIAVLREEIATLDERLTPVLQPCNTGSAKQDAPKPVGAPLAEFIEARVEAVEAMTAEVASLRARLEI